MSPREYERSQPCGFMWIVPSVPDVMPAGWLVRSTCLARTIPRKRPLVIEPHFPAPGVYTVKVCTQCGDCAAVCPTEAIKQNEQGAYYVDYAECNLCEACVPVCPEDVMFVRVELANTAWKCDLCGDCVEVCGTSALWIAEIEPCRPGG